MKFLVGYKTFIVAVLVMLASAVILFLPSVTFSTIPDFVWVVVAGLGFASVRDAVDTISKNDNKGWKTYLAAVSLIVLGAIKGLGVEIPADIMEPILTGITGFGVYGLRDALKMIEPNSLKI